MSEARTVGRTAKLIRALLWQSYFCLGLVIQPSIPISKSTLVNHRDWRERAETSNERALHMFKSQHHHARATASGELVKGSISAEESRKFKTWRAGFVLLTEQRRKNEVGCNKLPLTKDAPGDERSGVPALSRWENEGGSVRDECRCEQTRKNRRTHDLAYTIQHRRRPP